MVFLHSLSLAWFCISHSCKSNFFLSSYLFSLLFLPFPCAWLYTSSQSSRSVFSLICSLSLVHDSAPRSPLSFQLLSLSCQNLFIMLSILSPLLSHAIICISQPTTFNYFVGNDKTNIKYRKNINQPTLICLDVKWHTRSL